MIPAGSFSYALQTEMLEMTFDTKPVLVPFGGPTEIEPSRFVQLLVSTLTAALMDQNLRDICAKLPDARLKLAMDEEKWELVVCTGSEQKTVLAQLYSSRSGSSMDTILNVLDHTKNGDLCKTEGRERFANMVFAKYLQHLPDYQLVGKHALMLVKSPEQENAPQPTPAKPAEHKSAPRPTLDLGTFSFSDADRRNLLTLPKKGLPEKLNTEQAQIALQDTPSIT